MLKRWMLERLSGEVVLERWRRAALKNKIVVLMYHEVLSDAEDIEAWTVVRESDIWMQMKYLVRHFQVIPLVDAFRYMEDPRDTDEPLVVVTFDDGYAGNKRCFLPIVEALRIPVTLFVSTAAVQTRHPYWYDRIIMALQSRRNGRAVLDLRDKGLRAYDFGGHVCGERRWTTINRLLSDLKALDPLTREVVVDRLLERWGATEWTHGRLCPLTASEVAELAKSPWVTIGAHSHCHNILVQLDRGQVRESVELSKRLLEEWTGRLVDFFAYPNGDYDENVIGALKSAGFRCGMTVLPRPWSASDSLFAIPRIGIGRYDSFEMFRAKVSGLSL